jgi:serine/threonine protein kinase
MPATIFISYAHEDANWMEDFKGMFTPALTQGRINLWSDEGIEPGKNWLSNIQKALATAKIGLLLVSKNFLNSKFIHEVELKNLLDSTEKGGVEIRWVPISSCLYDYTPLSKIQACWDPQEPLDRLSDADRMAAIRKICLEIVEKFGAAVPRVSQSRGKNIKDEVQARLSPKYEITGELDSGKFSIVYRAERRQPKQVVAVKALVASELDERARQLFIEGIERAYKLNSPALIKIFDSFMDDSPEFLIAELVEGEKLNHYLRKYPNGLPLTKVKSILLHLTKALAEAHELGFRRGEMYPSDILIQASGLPKLSSFDFTNLLREDAQMTGNFLVDWESLAYMTPERYWGRPSTVLTDQYSLGIIATELLGGSSGSPIPAVVHPCDFEKKRDLFAKLESAEGSWAKRSPEFTGLVCRMLCSHPEERWLSMTELRNALLDIEPIESTDDRHRIMAKRSYLRFQAPELQRQLFNRFYKNLFAALPDVEQHFRSIDMERQYTIVNEAVHRLLEFNQDCSEQDKQYLQKLAKRHAAMGLSQRHCELFADTLVKTIGEFRKDDPDELEAWQCALQSAVGFLCKCQQEASA